MKLCGSCFRSQTKAGRLKALIDVLEDRVGSGVSVQSTMLGKDQKYCPNCHLPCFMDTDEWPSDSIADSIARLEADR